MKENRQETREIQNQLFVKEERQEMKNEKEARKAKKTRYK